MMERIMNYVKPELIVVAVVLYFIGTGLKQSQTVKDKYIPLILGGLALPYVQYGCLLLVRLVPGRRSQWRYSRRLYREF